MLEQLQPIRGQSNVISDLAAANRSHFTFEQHDQPPTTILPSNSQAGVLHRAFVEFSANLEVPVAHTDNLKRFWLDLVNNIHPKKVILKIVVIFSSELLYIRMPWN